MSDNTPQGDNTPSYEPPVPSSAPDAPETAAPPAYETSSTPAYDAPPSTPPYAQQPAAPAYPGQAAPAPSAYAAAPAYPGGNAYGSGQAYAAPTTTNTLSIVSLIAGIAGLTILVGIASIVAVITGHMSLNKLKTSGENGRGMAIAGLITGYVGIAFGALIVLLFIVMWAAIATYSY